MSDEGKAQVQPARKGFGRKLIRSTIPDAVIERSVNRLLEAHQSDENPTLVVAAFQSSI